MVVPNSQAPHQEKHRDPHEQPKIPGINKLHHYVNSFSGSPAYQGGFFREESRERFPQELPSQSAFSRRLRQDSVAG
jgi:hypothetical protein